MGLTGEHDSTLECVVYAVLNMRKEFMTKLTTGRNEARKILYKDLFFLVEKIASYDSVEAAEDDGFAIVLQSCGEPSEQPAGFISPDHLWEIGLCEFHEPGDSDLEKKSRRKRNMTKFKELSDMFPFLSVVLHYRKFATNPDSGEKEFIAMEAPISMYKVAADCLLAAYKIGDFEDILSLSCLALRAVHVHAVGIYALLRKLCGFELCAVESSCIGYITWKDFSNYLEEIEDRGSSGQHTAGSAASTNPTGCATRPNSAWSACRAKVFRAVNIQEAQVSAMYGSGTNVESDNEERPTLLMAYRKAKFEMAWSELVEEKNRREIERRDLVSRAASTQSAFDASGLIRMDIDDSPDWPGWAGAE